MKKTVFLALVFCCFCGIFSANASAQALINEIAVNPGGTDNPCEYVEIISTPGAMLQNLYFVSIEGDLGSSSTVGFVTAIISINNVTLGASGLLVITGTQPCGTRTYPAGTIVNRRVDWRNSDIYAAGRECAGCWEVSGANCSAECRSVVCTGQSAAIEC